MDGNGEHVSDGTAGLEAEREFELHEPGFEGTLRIEDEHGERHVIVSGFRPDASHTAVQKDLPADRDPRLAELVELCVDGDDDTATEAAVEVLSHVGVRDPG
jgi:hypothetical protein